MKPQTITKAFIIAGLTNLTVLIWSRLFTNKTVNKKASYFYEANYY